MLAVPQTPFVRCAARHVLALRVLSGWLACSLLSACVTETAGNFAESSRNQALSNYLELASAYVANGDMRNARRHLENAAELDPNNSEAAGLWALVYSREGEAELADTNFRRALRLDRSNSQARNNYAAFLYAQARFAEAHEHLLEVVRDTTYIQRPQAFENLGVAALQLSRTADAEAAFERALALNGDLSRASLELTSINLDQGEVLQARQYFRNYSNLMQLQQRKRDARGLWLGARLEAALGNDLNVYEYGDLLEAEFSATEEYKLYLQLLDTFDDD